MHKNQERKIERVYSYFVVIFFGYTEWVVNQNCKDKILYSYQLWYIRIIIRDPSVFISVPYELPRSRGYVSNQPQLTAAKSIYSRPCLYINNKSVHEMVLYSNIGFIWPANDTYIYTY